MRTIPVVMSPGADTSPWVSDPPGDASVAACCALSANLALTAWHCCTNLHIDIATERQATLPFS